MELGCEITLFIYLFWLKEISEIPFHGGNLSLEESWSKLLSVTIPSLLPKSELSLGSSNEGGKARKSQEAPLDRTWAGSKAKTRNGQKE